MRSEPVRKKAWVVVSMGVIAAVAATGVFGGSIAQVVGGTRRGCPEADAERRRPRQRQRYEQARGHPPSPKVRKHVPRPARGAALHPRRRPDSDLRRGGACTGVGACRVKVAALAAVAAQFVGAKTQPQSPVQSALAEPGSYRGRHVGGYPVSFFVAAGGSGALNLSIRPSSSLAPRRAPTRQPIHLDLEDGNQA